MSSLISRRQMIFTSGGVVLAGGFTKPMSAQQSSAEKEIVFRTTEPRNGEPQLAKLVESWITPTKHFYVRSHAPNPVIAPAGFKLRVEGLVRKPLTLSLGELTRFPARSTTATLTCAGNRRAEFNREGEVGGVQWEAGAIGNATWGGVSLADVLREAEVFENARHVWFEGLDEIEHGGGIIPFGGSIPMDKAMLGSDAVPGAMLVDRMNDAPLTPDHGFPLRAVVPGYIGARSVKWLGKVVVSDRPSPNHYVATAYKIVTKTDPIDWLESGPIYRYPINAAICTPAPRARVQAGTLEVTGYVLPTGRAGSRVSAVQVSANQGKSWVKAELTGAQQDFCWQLWKAQVPVVAETKRLIVKAVDSSGGFMPGRVPWNAKGYLQNAWYRLPIQVAS
jgi:sulfite oxidase